MLNELFACLDLIYATQKERGFAALYLRASGKRDPEAIKNHMVLLDEALKKLAALSLPRQIATKRDRFLEKTKALTGWREALFLLAPAPVDLIENYAHELVIPAIAIAHDILIHESGNSPGRVGALTYLLHLQETLALEREMGTIAPEPDEVQDRRFIEKLKDLIAEQQAYERLFWTLADETQRQMYASIKTSHASGNLGDDINAAVMEGRPLPMLRFYSSLEWFTIFSVKIDALHEITHKLAAHLMDEAGDIAFSASPPQALETDLEGHFEIIKNLPLFKNVSSAVLRHLLRTARLAQHDKGAILLTQGEPSSRFAIILDGWVKLYKSTPDGEEAILQVLGRKECLLESDPLQGRASSLMAKTVTKTKILSIPLQSMREHVTHDQDLALNLLNAAMVRAQKLATQFEQLTLRTAMERVGWFLLNLHIEGGSTGAPLTLPFDKSLIASYLGITPETFSRILQTLKTKGFRIERQKIYMPDAHALCHFCDSEGALRCCNAIIRNCLRPEAEAEKKMAS